MIRMTGAVILAFVGAISIAAQPQPASTTSSQTVPAQTSAPPGYFPDRFDWQHKRPEEVGMSPALVSDAIQTAVGSELRNNRDLALDQATSFGRNEPFDTVIGPMKARGPASGVIVRNGYIVAEWGEPGRVDMTHSVTKTFLTTVVGLAWQRGLIRDVNDRARGYMPPGVELFESEHNQKITWDHLLRQTSDWQGTLWGKPDWGDRPRGDLEQWKVRVRNEPGAVFTYNDVRVNALALATLTVWRRPLPQVLREYVMDPIGASNTWRWYGYDTSWIILDGQLVQSVSGGGHWGGGMWISAMDMARFGYLTLRKGKWGDRQLLSEEWIRMATTPGPNQNYGFMNFYLNTGRRSMPSAPEQAFWHLGAGSNIVYVDPVNDLVVVARWIRNTRAMDGVVAQLTGSGNRE
jgi:hypothetical protein